MNQKLKKALKQYGAVFEERQELIPATIGTDDTFGMVEVPNKTNYVYVRIQSGEIAQAYNTKVVPLAGLRVWCGYEKTRPGLLQVLDVRNVYGKEYQQKVPSHAETHEFGGYDQMFVRGEQFIPKLVSKYSGMTVRIQAGAIYTDDFGWYWHRPQDLDLSPYVPITGAHWALLEVGYSGTINVKLGSTVETKYVLYENTIPAPSNNAQALAAVAMYQSQSGISASKYGGNDILDLRWYQSVKTGTAGGGGGIAEAPLTGLTYGRNSGTWVQVSGTGGGTTTLNLDLKIDQTSGTSGYGTLKGNQDSSNLYFEVSEGEYASGRLLVFVNGQALSQGIDWSEQYPSSGTFYFISGSHIPTPSNIITAVYTITTGTSGGGIAEAPLDGLQYGRQSGSWTVVTGSGAGGIAEAPLDGLQYGRQSGSWTLVTGSSGISDAPLDGLQYARQSGTWKQVTGSGVTSYSQLTDVRITGTPQQGSTPVWISASGAWYPMPIYPDIQDPTGFLHGDDIVIVYNPTNRTIYLSGTLDYYWHGIKRWLGNGVEWTSSAHSTGTNNYYLYSSDGNEPTWSTTAWSLDLLQVAYVNSYGFAIREVHGIMPWEVHEELHRVIGSYRESGGAPIAGSYQTNSADNAHTRPSFASAITHDEDLQTQISSVTGTYNTLRFTSGSIAQFQTGEAYPFRATGSYILVNTPSVGTEVAATNNRYVNVYQIMFPVSADATSQPYRMVFLQPQAQYTSLATAQQEQLSSLDLGNLSSILPETIFYTRITYYTSAGYANIGKVDLESVTYVSKFAGGFSAGGGGGGATAATYVLSGTNYNMSPSVGVATEYARADHHHGTPPSGTGGGTTTITNNVFTDIRINQSSGTSVYPNLIGNQDSSNLYFKVSDNIYTSGKLLIFLNGQALSQGIDWSEQFPSSGTFYFISGSTIPTSSDIITAQYTVSGTLSVADAPADGLQYGRQSGSWTRVTGSGGGVSFSTYKWSGDIYPTSPSLLNDEFDNGSLDAKWTRFDPIGNCTITETGTYNALIMAQASRVGDQIAGIYQVMPTGTNYTAYIKISTITRYANYWNAGFALWSLNSGSTMTTFHFASTSSAIQFASNKWNNYGSYASNSFNMNIGFITTPYIRVRKNGTNYYGAFSSDGIGWIENPTAVVPTNEPAYFGIFIDNNGLGVSTKILAHFFRYVPYDVGVDGIMNGGLRGLS